MTIPKWLGPDAAQEMAREMASAHEGPEPDTLEYWKQRAISAERKVARMENRAVDQSWELSNYREDAQRRRDAEIGEMGGGG